MTQYSSLNVKLSNSELNKLKSATENDAEVVLRLSSNMVGNSDDKTNCQYKLLSNSQVANLRRAFANYSSTDIKLSKLIYLRWYNQVDFLVNVLVHY